MDEAHNSVAWTGYRCWPYDGPMARNPDTSCFVWKAFGVQKAQGRIISLRKSLWGSDLCKPKAPLVLDLRQGSTAAWNWVPLWKILFEEKDIGDDKARHSQTRWLHSLNDFLQNYGYT